MDGFCLEILGSVLAAHADEQTRGTFAPFRSSSEAPQTVAKKKQEKQTGWFGSIWGCAKLEKP
jgi:hypothetical protein